jgi:hypothetical protein
MFRNSILVGSLPVLAMLIALPSQTMAQRVRAVSAERNVEIQLADDAIIRVQKAPKQIDDKGKPVTPTHEQLKALKGDPKQPGYAAELSDLKVGQIVQVSLGKLKKPKDTSTSGAGDEKKPQKSHWTSLGEITGRVAKVHGVDDKGKGDKNAQPTLVISVDTVLLARMGHNPSSHGNVTLGADVFATKAMILSQPATDKQSSSK